MLSGNLISISKRTLKDWFYLEMVSPRAIDDIMQTPKKEVHFFFFSVCFIIFNCSWQLIMFDKKQKCCVKRIHLVPDNGWYDRKAFYTVKMVFYSSSITFICSKSTINNKNTGKKVRNMLKVSNENTRTTSVMCF